MTAPIYTLEEYLGALQNLLPHGRAWNTDPTSVQARLEAGLISAFQRVNVDDAELLADAFPATAHFLLPEWEAALGLPDPCAGPAPTIAERQAQVVAKLTDGGGQSAARFIELAGILGYSVTVTSFAPFRSGQSHSGDELGEPGAYFLWQVNAPATTSAFFLAGGGHSGDELQTFGNDVLECSIRERAPAHTTVRFTYGAQYEFLEEGFGSNFVTDFHYVRPVGDDAVVAQFTALWTFTRAGSGMYRGLDGLYHYANENRFLRGNTFSDAAWTKTRLTVTANAALGPDGQTMNAWALVEDGTAAATHQLEQNIAFAEMVTTLSVTAKKAARRWLALQLGQGGTCYFDLETGTVGSTNGAIAATMTAVGNGFYRCRLSRLVVNNANALIFIGEADNDATFDGVNGQVALYIEKAQLQLGADLGDYIDTAGAAVFNTPRLNYNAASPVRRLLHEPQVATVGTYPRNLANAAWTKTNCTATRTATGIDGVANTASRLTATSANATCLQAVVSGSTARRFTPFVRRVTGTGNIDITLDNGSTWTTVTLTGAWTRVPGIAQTLANPTFGFRIVTNGDAIEVDFANVENSSFGAATSPIESTNAPVTRQGEDITRTFGAEYDTTKGTFLAKFFPLTTDYTNSLAILRRDNNSYHASLFAGGTMSIYDGTTSTIPAGAFSALAPQKVASTFGAARGLGISLNGGVPVRAAFDGTWGAGTAIRIGNPNGGSQAAFELEWLFYYPAEAVDTWLRAQSF